MNPQSPPQLSQSLHRHENWRRGVRASVFVTALPAALSGFLGQVSHADPKFPEGLGKKALHFDDAAPRKFGQRSAAGFLKLAKP